MQKNILYILGALLGNIVIAGLSFGVIYLIAMMNVRGGFLGKDFAYFISAYIFSPFLYVGLSLFLIRYFTKNKDEQIKKIIWSTQLFLLLLIIVWIIYMLNDLFGA